MERSITFGKQPLWVRALFLGGGALALSAGLYGRFKGVGVWPLAVDEFYISRSIDNILSTGLPGFKCGGFYTRGVLFQYVVAGMRLIGVTPEYAARLVAGVSSLAVLPAAYLLATRMAGWLAGGVTVVILCVSVWEIEMARFGRMYAPFQAVFTWYLVFFLRYTIDKDRAALGWMVALSVIGVLTWEGGALLGIGNILAIVLLHERGNLRRGDSARLFGLAVLAAALFLATRDLRGFADLPADDSGDTGSQAGHLHFAVAWAGPLLQHPAWAIGLVPALGLAFASLNFMGSYRRRPLAAAGLCAAMAAAALHLFVVCVGVLAVMLVARLIDWRELIARRAQYFTLALLGFLVYWSVFEIWSGGSSDAPASAAGASGGRAMPPFIREVLGFPDVYDGIIRPWARTLPLLSVGLVLMVFFWLYRIGAARTEKPDPISASLSILFVTAMAVGLAATTRIETRYTFFLYPLLICMAVAAMLQWLQRRRETHLVPVLLCATVPLLCFGASEDFQPGHIARIDSADVNFRVGMSLVRVAHYYPRSDMRIVGQWLASHVRAGDVVMTGIPNLDEYYGDYNYFFLDDDDPRYEAYVCRDGVTDRWTNHSVLYGEAALESIVASGHRVLLTVYADTAHHLEAAAPLQGWSVTRVWTTPYGDTAVLAIVPTAARATNAH